MKRPTTAAYWTRRLDRRRLLRLGAAGAAGLAGAALIACGGGSKSEESDVAATGGATGATDRQPEAERPRRGGTLRLGSRSQPGTMDPHFGGGGFDERYEWFVFDNLVMFDSKGGANFDESLTQSMELADSTTIIFKLRNGVKFHDGGALTADVVKWNIDRSLDPNRSATAKPQFAHIRSVDAVDAQTVRFNLTQPDSTLVGSLGGKGGMVVSRQTVEKIGDDQFARNPVGTGPFTFVSWRDESDLRFKQNPDYWRRAADGGPDAYVDEVFLRIIPEAVVIASALQTGEIDHIDEPGGGIEDLTADTSIDIRKFEGNGMIELFWNHGLAPLDNVDFRRAVASAWDRETWSKLFFQGQLRPADAVIPPGSWAYQPTPQHPKFDLNVAKQLVEKSGVPEAQRTFSITGGATWGGANAVTLFVNDMAKVGIKVNYEPTTQGKTFKATGGDGTYQAISSLSLRPDPDGWFSQLYRAKSTYNLGWAPTPGIEPLLDKAAASYDLNERNQIYAEVRKITSEQMYSTLSGLFRNGFAYSRKNVRGVRFGADGKGRLAQMWLAS
jgi:ABC-type transport system substrate-binding protein